MVCCKPNTSVHSLCSVVCSVQHFYEWARTIIKYHVFHVCQDQNVFESEMSMLHVVVLSVNVFACQTVHLNMFDYETVQVACKLVASW